MDIESLALQSSLEYVGFMFFGFLIIMFAKMFGYSKV